MVDLAAQAPVAAHTSTNLSQIPECDLLPNGAGITVDCAHFSITHFPSTQIYNNMLVVQHHIINFLSHEML